MEKVSQIPQQFAKAISNERTKRLTQEVWERLPDFECELLNQILQGVSDHIWPSKASAAAFAGALDPKIYYPTMYVIILHQIDAIESDAAARFIIAHEFAHVALRHSLWAIVGEESMNRFYTPDELKERRLIKEDEADFQACVWGFTSEMIAWWRTSPEARRPRWYVEGDEQIF